MQFIDIDDSTQNEGLFRSRLIQKVFNDVWFNNATDEGIVFDEYFNPATKSNFSLVLTSVCTTLIVVKLSD